MGRKAGERAYTIVRAEDGCDVAPHCLECPLAECKYVDPYYYNLQFHTASQMRKERILAASQAGIPLAEIAEREGVHLRTIFRLRKTWEGCNKP